MTPHSATVCFETLGCKLNFAETAAIAQSVESKGFSVVTFDQKVDYYVINTCSVTENADKKCKKLIKDFKRINPTGSVVIIGCYAQLKPDEILAIKGVDLVLGASDKFKLGDFLSELVLDDSHNSRPKFPSITSVEEFYPAYSLGERTRSFLKVQDGCDYSCTFCTIPLARGKSRNGTIESIVKNAREIGADRFDISQGDISQGDPSVGNFFQIQKIREIVLTGVNIGDFGKTTGESFLELIRALDQISTIDRYRISSIEPNLLTPEIIEFVARSDRFMPHFHIPLQSGSDAILGRMRRRYRTEFYERKIKEIRNLLPFAGIGVDVIVGFPGENEEEFIKTYQFIESLDISYLHVFTYSERDNTIAVDFPQKVPPQEKAYRSKKLHELSSEKQQIFIERNLGQSFPVLFERGQKNGFMHGFTPNYIRLEVPYNPQWMNQIITIPVEDHNSLLKSLKPTY